MDFQTLAAYAAVAVAAAWVVWSVVLPRSLKQKLRTAGKKAPNAGKKGGCGPGCGCGD